MNLILTFVSIALFCSLTSADRQAWEQWKVQFNKNYSTEMEHSRRMANFLQNHNFIQQHNGEYEQGVHTFKVAHNAFSDMTREEIQKSKGLLRISHQTNGSEHYYVQGSSLPASVDWRQKGYVNAVKNQGQYGDCYAFATTAALEGQYKKKTGQLVSLSEQQIADCSQAYGNKAGNGGNPQNSFDYVKDHGIAYENDYPYIAKDEQCKKVSVSPVKVSGYTEIAQNDEASLTNAVASVGPIPVAIDASLHSFQFYSSGVYSDSKCSSTNLDHAVTVVGYGTNKGQNYFIIRNSWGTTWGEEGYMRMMRNGKNFCGVATYACYPNLA